MSLLHWDTTKDENAFAPGALTLALSQRGEGNAPSPFERGLG